MHICFCFSFYYRACLCFGRVAFVCGRYLVYLRTPKTGMEYSIRLRAFETAANRLHFLENLVILMGAFVFALVVFFCHSLFWSRNIYRQTHFACYCSNRISDADFPLDRNMDSFTQNQTVGYF